MSTTQSTALSYEVFVCDGTPRTEEQRMPDGQRVVSSPVSTTLIFGERDAVLVDPPFTRAQAVLVGDWVQRSGKRLTHIYATHGHGDHWFTTGELMKRFPGVTAYATEATIEMMHRQATEGRAQLWDRVFPGLVPESPVLAQAVPAEGFHLEGNALRAVATGHTDTDGTSVLHVPSIGLVVAGDVVYNGVHQYILEGGDGGLDEWLAALDRVSELHPRAVVAGHKNRELPDHPDTIEQTRQYLRDVIRLLKTEPTAREFYDRMLRLHPDRLNPGPLWYGAKALLSDPSPLRG